MPEHRIFDVLFISSRIGPALLEFGGEFQDFDKARLTGHLKDGRSFLIASTSVPFWADRIQGVRFREYRLVGNAAFDLKPRDLYFLQSRMEHES